MCMIQTNTNPVDLVQSLPHDVQALVLIYTGHLQNVTSKLIHL